VVLSAAVLAAPKPGLVINARLAGLVAVSFAAVYITVHGWLLSSPSLDLVLPLFPSSPWRCPSASSSLSPLSSLTSLPRSLSKV